ncbi:formin-like protein 19 [Lotus japonicus]|uniref:formin-like protein 19 n=1 Tax=Lotus japonicus TaxID=34305 RepID=UPI002585818D|nr:formin-like protein 19 [Lotus japonicus]
MDGTMIGPHLLIATWASFNGLKKNVDFAKRNVNSKRSLDYFLELMKVPRVESKLRVFAFKIQYGCQITEFKRSLNTVNSACEEVRNSLKLKEIMKKILYLGNTLNQGTARGSAVGFKLESLLKLTDTRASNSRMTLMHYLCKVLAEKSPGLLDFHLGLVSLETATKVIFWVLWCIKRALRSTKIKLKPFSIRVHQPAKSNCNRYWGRLTS